MIDNDADIIQSKLYQERNGIVYKSKSKYKILAFLCIIGFVAVYGIISLFTLAENIYAKTYVRGVSMQPTLNMNKLSSDETMDIVYINTKSKGTNGDIIVDFYAGKYVIKRIIATAGQSLKIVVPQDTSAPTEVYVDNILLDEPYIKEKHFDNIGNNYSVDDQGNKYVIYNIPQGYVFYMGDNRNNSTDCRSTGPRITNNIAGRVDFIVNVGNNDPDYSKTFLFFQGLKVIFTSIF